MITRKTCELLDKANSTWYEFWESMNNLAEKIADIVTLKNSIKYGLINLSDIAIAELTATVKNMASRVADALLDQASSVAAKAIAAILQPLLRILLFAPNAIFTMIEIPHKRASEAAKKERLELQRAMSNLDVVMYIMQKWLGDNNHPGYRRQIELAIPMIERCLKLISELIDGLSDPANSYFDEFKYSELQKALNKAIISTETRSDLEKKLKIKAQQQAAANIIYKQKMKSINKKYREEKAKIKSWYDNKMVQANKSETNSGAAIQEMIITEQYSFKMEYIEFEYNYEKKSARTKAEAEALIRKETYTSALKNAQNDFQNDLIILNQALFNIYEAIKNALSLYTISYKCCQTIVNSQSMIKKMIAWLIAILRTTGNTAADDLILSLEKAEDSIAVADIILKKAVNKKSILSKTANLTALIQANTMLKTGDAIIEASVIKELISIINSDERLGTSDLRFTQFIERMNDIPDWKIKDLSWLSDQGSISPYPNLLIKSTVLLTKIPIKLTVRDDSIYEDVNKVRNIATELYDHSWLVTKALQTFTPYNTPEGKQLRQLLSRMQLLDEFSIGFNIANTLYKLIKGFVNEGWQIPTPANCKSEFPDMKISSGNVKGEMLNVISAATFADLVLINPNDAVDKDFLPQKANIDFKNPLDNFVDISPENETRYE